MDDAFKDGRGSHGWSLGDFHYHKKPNEKGRQLSKPSLFIRSAAEIELPREIRSYLSRRSSHVSDWVLIVGNRAHYNLRTSDRVQLFEKTRKGWVPLKELNGIRSGQEVLAFQRRPTVRSSKYLGDARRDLPGQLAYDAMVQQVFFHRDLKAYLNGHGYPSREQILQRLNRPSLEQMSRTLDNVERVETAKHWICLNLHDADGQPAAGYPYRLRDSGGAERRGELDNQGEAREVNLTDGPVEVIFGEAIDLSSVASQRQAIKQGLDTVLKAERAEADAIEAEFQQKSLFGKLGALEEARATGAREAVWGLMTGFKELSDLATQHVNHAISAAWESWRYSEEGEYTEQFVQHFVDAEFKELADVLGFDPRSLTREQWADTLALANFIWHDGETRELLIKFAQDYINAQHFLETTEAVSGFATEFAFELAIAILTLGAGASVAVASKARHLNKLKELTNQFRQLAQSLRRQAGSKKGTGRTGQWHYQTLEKPNSKGIEKGRTGKTFKFKNLQPMNPSYVGEETGAVWGTKVKYLNAEERLEYQVQVDNGKMYDSEGELFDTSSASSAFGGDGNAIFVMDESGNIYASSLHAVGKFHHSSFLSGQPVASAGEIVVDKGVIKEITRRSGHYQPTEEQLDQFLHRLDQSGIDLTEVNVGAGF